MTSDISDANLAAKVVAELAIASTEPRELARGKIYGWITPNGDVEQIDLTGDEYLEQPRRKAGRVTVEDVDSFAAYYLRHADDSSEVFADLDAATVTAVLDGHHAADSDQMEWGGGGWQQHRLTLALRKTDPWKDWTGNDGRMMGQAEFAEFLESHATDVAIDSGSITAADLLEVAQKFQAHTKVTFSSGKRISSGETQLTYAEEIDAKAGDRGTIEVPNQFTLAIRPFDDADGELLIARFRYRVNGGNLTLGYKLDNPARLFREAVAQVVAKAAEATSATIMRGKPAA